MTHYFRKLLLRLFVICLASAPVITLAQNSFFRFPSPSGSFLAGQFAFRGLNTGQAASALMDAAESQWSNPAVVERAFAALIADGRIKEAQPVARHMLEMVPDNNLAKLVLATVALKERRYSSVITNLENMGLSDFVDISASVLRAWARVGQSNLGLAYDELDELSSGSIESFLVFHKALMADIVGDSTAIEQAKAAYENDPYLGRIVEFYARTLGNAGRTEAALDVIENFENEGLIHPTVQYVRAELEAGRLPGKYVTNISAAAAELYQGIGIALGRDGASDIALVFLRLGLYLNPSEDTISLTVAQLLETEERFEDANLVYQQISSDSLYKPDAIVRVAQNLDSLGDRPEAIRRLKNIVAVDPENLGAISALGELYRIDEQFDQAAIIYTKAIELVGGSHPRDWRYFYLRGIANERRGEWEMAEQDFLRALELNPTQPQVLNYLGYSWVDKGINLQQALGMIEQAVRTNPGDGYIVDSLGWAVFKLNRFEDAVRILEEAVQLNPNDPEINDHLGDAYWRVGRKNEARFQWSIALDMDTRGNVTDRVLPKLEDGLPELLQTVEEET